MNRSDLIDLLERYSRGETSPEENLRVKNWLSEEEPRDSVWQTMSSSSRKQWLNNLWIDIDKSTEEPAIIVSMQQKRRFWPMIAAAAAIVIITIGIWWWPETSLNNKVPAELIAANTSTGETKSVTLSDGTIIWLNKGSKIKYPEKFTGKNRDVYLDGEAYFDVKHDEDKSFIVHTGKIMTTVIGTAFNIVGGENDSAITVTVTRGKVKVSEGDKLLDFITPNQQISYNTSSRNFTKTTVDAAEAISWKSGDLLFDDITFGEAAEILSNRFHVKISFANERIKACRFSGTALSGKNIDEILKVISAFNHAEFRYNQDGSIIIEGKGCS
jgi:transmembrane sensor